MCPHCNLWLCSSHHQEHQQIVQANAHTLNDRVNQVRQDLIDLSLETIYEKYKRKADEWRDHMYAEVTAKHAEMMEQLEKSNNELTEEVTIFKKDKLELFTHDIAEPLKSMLSKQKQIHPDKLKIFKTKLDSLEEQMEKIRNPDIIQLNCDNVKLKGEIHFTCKHPFDEKKLECEDNAIDLNIVLRETMHNFSSKSTCKVLAASPDHILTVENPSTLILFNKTSRLQSINIVGMNIHDSCWSDTMKVFFIASEHLQIYDILSNTLKLATEQCLNPESHIFSVATYCHDLFLIRKNGVVEHYLLPSFTQKKKWSRSIYLDQDRDKIARCIRINSNGVLAISIKQNDSHWRIDLFNTQMKLLYHGPSFMNHRQDGPWRCMFSPITNNEWLMMNNSSTSQMLSILDKEGKLKQEIKRSGSNVALMGTEILVLRDHAGLYLYKL